MRLAFIVATGAALAACSSFDPIQRGVCGNGLVETGEDCDSNDATCIACSVVCTAAADCPTTDYTCGVDGLCHAPGGALGHPLGTGSFETNTFAITDIDQDGIGDAVGASRSSLVIRYGDSAGSLANVDSIVTPSQTGNAAFGYLDDDASLDVTITTPDGIVAYTSPYGTLSPLPVQTLLGMPGGMPVDPKLLFGAGKVLVAGFIPDPVSQRLGFVVIDFVNPTIPSFTPPCGQALTASDIDIADVDGYQMSSDLTFPVDFVVSSLIGTGATRKPCVMHIRKDSLLAAPVVTDITPTLAPMLSHRPVLADLTDDSDPCPSLVNTSGGTNSLRAWSFKLSNGHCVAQPAALGGDPLPAMGTTVPDVLVASDGVYSLTTATSPSFEVAYHSTRRLAHVAYADLDGDNAVDLVLAASGEDDLDVLYHYGLLPVFQLFRIDTASAASTITIDDYDGDKHPDIAYTEPVGDHTRLMVAYGTGDRPEPPFEVGAFSGVLSVIRLDIADTVDVLGTDADLALLIPGKPASFSILHGSPQRTMLPYYDPRAAGPTQDDTIFRGSAVGHFIPDPLGGTSHADLLAIATPKDLTSSGGIKAWIAFGTGTTLDSATSDGVTVNGLAACGLGQSGTCVEDATILAWPLGPDRAVMLGIDHSQPVAAAVVDPGTVMSSQVTARPAPQLVAAIPANTVVQTLHVADLDGDGTNELVAAFAPVRGTTAKGAVLVCTVDSTGMPQSCVDIVPAIVAMHPDTVSCTDASTGRFGFRDRFSTPTAGLDLVVLCQGGGTTLHRVVPDGAGVRVEQLAHTTETLSQLQVGDVTGDGVDDIVAITGDAGARSLVVFPQCTSNDVSCQHAANTGSEMK